MVVLYSIEFTETFKENLYNIFWNIFSEFGDIFVAEKIINDIMAKCHRLSLFPKAHIARFTTMKKEIRFVHSGRYTIIYSINEKTHTVEMQHVLHSRQNILDLFN
ncbi:type II toxin-antitoxin system RelE/ParE family toxin [Candidatus Saccharibacteria bacterium]|nr:type II toxin-antitoxin system RelE/ParE family toxin [Candidatus Saccharibacteria bacterium]